MEIERDAVKRTLHINPTPEEYRISLNSNEQKSTGSDHVVFRGKITWISAGLLAVIIIVIIGVLGSGIRRNDQKTLPENSVTGTANDDSEQVYDDNTDEPLNSYMESAGKSAEESQNYSDSRNSQISQLEYECIVWYAGRVAQFAANGEYALPWTDEDRDRFYAESLIREMNSPVFIETDYGTLGIYGEKVFTDAVLMPQFPPYMAGAYYYLGDCMNGIRQGHGVWFSGYTNQSHCGFYIAEGEWVDDSPQGLFHIKEDGFSVSNEQYEYDVPVTDGRFNGAISLMYYDYPYSVEFSDGEIQVESMNENGGAILHSANLYGMGYEVSGFSIGISRKELETVYGIYGYGESYHPNEGTDGDSVKGN